MNAAPDACRMLNHYATEWAILPLLLEWWVLSLCMYR